MTRKLTIEEINKRIKKRNIKCVGKYLGNNIPTMWKCLVDGYEWETTYSSIQIGSGCHKCSNVIRYTNLNIDEKLKKRNIIRLTNCNGAFGLIKWKCLNSGCGHIWESTPKSVIGSRQSGCHKCSITINHNEEIIREKLKLKNIEQMEKYKNSNTKIKFKCLVCNHEWQTKIGIIILNDCGCPNCAKIKQYCKIPQNEFFQLVIKNTTINMIIQNLSIKIVLVE